MKTPLITKILSCERGNDGNRYLILEDEEGGKWAVTLSEDQAVALRKTVENALRKGDHEFTSSAIDVGKVQ